MMSGYGWGMALGGWLWMIVGLVLVAAAIWWIASAASRSSRGAGDETAEVLRRRLAAGEINNDEYEQARRLLGI